MGYILSAFFRSFLIQSSWNFERMQSLGFFYSISPAIKGIHRKREELKEASERHLEFFNTNPYMAPAIIGATIRLEENGASDEEIRSLKTGLMGPYGAIGDSLFWGSLRPLAAIIGVVLALHGFIWAPLAFLLVYNVPHIFMRGYGMVMGHRLGIGVVGAIRGLDIPGKVMRIKEVTIFFAGFLLPHLIFSVEGGIGTWVSALIPISVIAFLWGLEKGMRVELLAFLSVAGSVAFGLFL
jgi:PTS system mannose-specific IID component